MKPIRIILSVIIPILILLIVVFDIKVRTGEIQISVLEYQYPAILSEAKATELLAREKISADFTAKEDYLGIVAIRFNTYGRMNTDSVAFRIKEKGSQNWYYTNTYNSKEFGGYTFFPFGFPVIVSSKDKTYTIEIESLEGEEGNAVGLSSENTVLVTKHQVPKTFGYFVKKAINIIQNL